MVTPGAVDLDIRPCRHSSRTATTVREQYKHASIRPGTKHQKTSARTWQTAATTGFRNNKCSSQIFSGCGGHIANNNTRSTQRELRRFDSSSSITSYVSTLKYTQHRCVHIVAINTVQGRNFAVPHHLSSLALFRAFQVLLRQVAPK